MAKCKKAQPGSIHDGNLIGANNIIAFIDNNDFQSLGRTSVTHPSFYPLGKKLESFGWDCLEINGHDNQEIYESCLKKIGKNH